MECRYNITIVIQDLDSLLASAISENDLERAQMIATLKQADAESYKTRAEADNLEKAAGWRSEDKVSDFKKFWYGLLVGMLVPLASIATLYATNKNQADAARRQADQFDSSQKELALTEAHRQQEAEDSRWVDAEKTIHELKPTGSSLDAGVELGLLNSFVSSTKYGSSARILLRHLLRQTEKDSATFKEVLDATVRPDDPNDLSLISQLDREISSARSPLVDNNGYALANLKADQQGANNAYIEDLRNLSGYLGPLLRLALAKPGTHQLDASSLAIWNVDCTNLDFKDANVDDAAFDDSNLTGADLSHVVGKPTATGWQGVAWWHAHKIRADILKDLETNWNYEKYAQVMGSAALPWSDYLSGVKTLDPNYSVGQSNDVTGIP